MVCEDTNHGGKGEALNEVKPWRFGFRDMMISDFDNILRDPNFVWSKATMCIVSFVLTNRHLIVTFNRDEDPSRAFEDPISDAMKDVFSPLDKVAGGTWIGSNKHFIMCLQNGAREKHVRDPPYEKSRGILLMELLKGGQPDLFPHSMRIKMEPFTLCLLDKITAELQVHYYDGKEMTREMIDLSEPFVSCSSTLYDVEALRMIRSDFNSLEAYEPGSILQFHKDHCIGGEKNHFVKKAVSTTSITQFVLEEGAETCSFVNLLSLETKNYRL